MDDHRKSTSGVRRATAPKVIYFTLGQRCQQTARAFKSGILLLTMKSSINLSRILLPALVALATVQSHGQLTKIRDYALHQQEDRGVLFGTALTEDHSLLTVVAHEDGEWPLTKVSKWWDEHPEEEQIRLRAFSKKDRLSGPLEIRLLPTPDGQFAVLLISAGMKVLNADHHSDQMFAYVVRLNPFQVIASAQSKELGIDGILSGFLDPNGDPVVIASIYPAVQSENVQVLHTYYRLAIPRLHVSTSCSYSLPQNSNTEATAAILEKNCSEFARAGGFSSAVDMDKLARNDADHPKPPFPVDNNLGWPLINEGNGSWLGTSANSEEMVVLNGKGEVVHRFEPGSMCGKQPVSGPAWICDCKLLGGRATDAVIECETSHDNLFGWSVGLKQWIAEVDADHERDISKVVLPIRDNFEAKFVDIGSTSFLLTVVNGSRLQIFSVRSSF